MDFKRFIHLCHYNWYLVSGKLLVPEIKQFFVGYLLPKHIIKKSKNTTDLIPTFQTYIVTICSSNRHVGM